MGELNVHQEADQEKMRVFMRALLSDLQALEQMLESHRIESGVRRIGFEQEMFLVDRNLKPAPIAGEVLKLINDPRFTTELAKFNLEFNSAPIAMEGRCLYEKEQEMEQLVGLARDAASKLGAEVLLAGILPTLTLDDLKLENLTDAPRYHELNRTLGELRSSTFSLLIKGLDEIYVTHDNMMLEACNTSFQIHLQVDPEAFPASYNLTQAITAPVLAAAVNSPLLFGKRLWAETRVAVFQQSVDERSPVQKVRNRETRVSFGQEWVRKSVLELFRGDIARFRVILTHAMDEDPSAVLARGEAPLLSALRLHNGTVWRWNRPCYGILDGKPHLRIETRVLPSGPTVLDEVANAAFFYGLMFSLPDEYGPIDRIMNFDDTKHNFLAAARLGLNAQLHWIQGRTIAAKELILSELLPLSRQGLKHAQIDSADIDRYLGVIQERIESGQTGSSWALKSLAAMDSRVTGGIRNRTLAATMLECQKKQEPVHRWPLALVDELRYHYENYKTVGQFMSTDFYTVRPEDLVDLVASIMHWQRIHHVLVEDENHQLVGLVSQRDLLQLLAQGSNLNRAHAPVSVVMKRNPVTVTPETKTADAIEIMRQNRIGSLPVVKGNRLVGMVDVYDILSVASDIFEKELRKLT